MYIYIYSSSYHYDLSQDIECAAWWDPVAYLFCCLHCSAFSRKSCSWNDSTQPFHMGFFYWITCFLMSCVGFLWGSVVKNPPATAGDEGSIPGWGGSPREGNDNPFYYPCLGNPTDRGAWRAAVHGFTRVRHGLATKQQQPVLPRLDS